MLFNGGVGATRTPTRVSAPAPLAEESLAIWVPLRKLAAPGGFEPPHRYCLPVGFLDRPLHLLGTAPYLEVPIRFERMMVVLQTTALTAWLWNRMVTPAGFEPTPPA